MSFISDLRSFHRVGSGGNRPFTDIVARVPGPVVLLMITFVVATHHKGTVTALREGILAPLMPRTRAISYDMLFSADRLMRGTYVFTDMERLAPSELRLASHYYRRLESIRGMRVLNDPARVRTRFALLRALREAHFNDFDAYKADSMPRPARFPVFLRIAAEHGMPLGGLIHGQEELEERLAALVDAGVPLAGVLVIEFCGAPGGHGYFERLSFFRIGERITLSTILIDEQWNVKKPRFDLMTPAILSEHLVAVREDRYVQTMRAAFDIAGIHYGRADVGIHEGRLQVYEINTNPNITATSTYVTDDHAESRRIWRARLGSMLHAVDTLVPGKPARVRIKNLDRTSKERLKRARDLAELQRRVETLEQDNAALTVRTVVPVNTVDAANGGMEIGLGASRGGVLRRFRHLLRRHDP